MKRKIIGILICILLMVATTLPVAGNIIKIDKEKLFESGILRDINLDLAITNAFSNKVNILVGDGFGGFTTSGNFSVENFPLGITDGDFNGDGILDLITTSYDNHNVTVLLGDGAGGFSSSENFSVGLNPLGIIDEDFNADGNQDIAVANTGGNNVSVLLGDGVGGFSPQQTYTIGNGPVDLCDGMFNADGNRDLMGANLDDDSVGLLLGDGAGGFVLSNSIYLGIDYRPYAITNADFNKDGDLDVVIASGGYPYIGVLLGDGAGGFGPLQNYTVGNGLERFDIISEDFNNDENPDIAVPNTDDNTVSVLLGNGTGGFGTHQTFPVGIYPVGICDGDFNADDNRDLAVTNAFDDTISILLGDGAGGFGTQQTYPAGSGPVGIISGNINYIPVPDLECQGSLHWTNVKPESTVNGEFEIGNTGDPGSILNWQIESYPTWGTWNFTALNGSIPAGVMDSIQVEVVAPNETKTEYTGKIKVINVDDPSNYCEIEVYLQTPRSKGMYHQLFYRIFERFPNAFPILRQLLGI